MQYTQGHGVTTVCPLSVCDGRMPLQRNAVSPARGITVDGQSREEKSMCVFCVRLQSSFALAHTNHYMIKSSYCITQKTQIHPDGGHPCYICNLEHILLHSRAPDTHLQCTPRPLQHHQLKSQMYGHGCINSVLAQISNSHTQSNSPDHRSHGTLKDQQTVRSYKFYIKISVHTV